MEMDTFRGVLILHFLSMITPQYHHIFFILWNSLSFSSDSLYSLFQFEGSDFISVLKNSLQYSFVFFKRLSVRFITRICQRSCHNYITNLAAPSPPLFRLLSAGFGLSAGNMFPQDLACVSLIF